jgi:hypothetical protein
VDEKELAVVRDDLGKAKEAFHSSSTSYQGYVPNGGRFLRVSGGDPQLDKIIDVSLGTIEEMHTILAQALYQHGSKLGMMFDTYNTAEDDATARVPSLTVSIQEIMRAKDGPPPLNEPPSF